MKLSIYIIILLLLIQNGYSQTGKGNTFNVSDVKVAEQLLEEHKTLFVIENHIDDSIEAFSDMADKYMVPTKMHAVVEALHYSFAQHRPICISPDMVWLMICQAVTQHINLNSDSLKSDIVKFKGEKQIITVVNEFGKGNHNNNWHTVINSFSDSIKAHIDNKLYTDYNLSFTTTGSNESIAFQVSMLNAVDNYFDFWTMTTCGIPQIKLSGTTKDWKLIWKRIDSFKRFGLGKWIDELKPILYQFIQASKGDINREFWADIYKLKNACDYIYVTGWIMKFFPYIKDKNNLVPNKNIYENNQYCDVEFSNIPSGISKVNFKWRYSKDRTNNTEVYSMEFWAGFIGISQNKQSKMLEPEILWFVKEKTMKPEIKDIMPHDSLTVEQVIIEEHIVDESPLSSPGKGTAIEKIKIDYGCYLPFDEEEEYYVINDETAIFDPENNSTIQESDRAIGNYVREQLKNIKLSDGEIIIEFIISAYGEIKNVSIISSNIPKLNDSVIKIIEEMPLWKPASQRGKNIDTKYTLPIKLSSTD